MVDRVRDNNAASGENSSRDGIINEPVINWVTGPISNRLADQSYIAGPFAN